MGIGELLAAFRQQPAQPAQAAQAAAPNMQAQGGPSAIPAGTPPNPGADPANQNLNTAPASPLDQFKDLWQTNPANTAATPDLNAPVFNVDPVKLFDAAKKIDFTRSISPEIVQKALSGDAEAFSAAINAAVQQSYAQSSHLTTQMIEQALKQNNTKITGLLPSAFKSLQVNEGLSANPAFQHPAAKPIVEALQAQFTKQYPHASAADIQKYALEYLNGFAQAVSPAPAPEPTAADRSAQDWSKFLDTP